MASSTVKEFAHLQIPLEEIVKATNNFADENIIGKGGFGIVYKGKLMRPGGELIDISARRLDRRHGQGEVEFWTEVSVVSGLKNHYARYMVGYCDENGEKIIINRHQPKGSLSMHVSNPSGFTWSQRLSVSFDIVKALEYIHYDVDHRYYIIHRNINSSTILLDDKWKAKLSGFEFSIKHAVHRMNQVFLCEAIGTRGYMDPAILKSGGVTHKSDIYSFGVVLFELLCGRKAVEDNKLLAPLAKHHYENGTLLQDIIHPDLLNQMDPESLKYFSEAAYSCLEENLAQRPDAKELSQKICKAGLIQWKDVKEDQDHSPLDAEKDVLQVTEKEELEDFNIMPSNIWKVKNLEHLKIGLRDIKLATNDFSETFKILYSHRYYAYKTELECVDREYLSSIDGKNIGELPKRRYTVKIMSVEYSEHLLSEIEIISSCKHRNIESLLGFCDEGPKMILVYEFISAHHLQFNLDNHKLTWGKRVKLCLDIAHGLNYLHDEMENQMTVIHGDIGSWCIELDDNWEGGKIVGFGSAVFLPRYQDDDTLSPNQIASTSLGVDPEYAKTRESDVYNYGSLMIEILSGKFINEMASTDITLGQMVREWVDKGTTKRKVAPILMEENAENKSFLNKGPNKDSLDTFINIAYQCLAETQNQRPTARVIIQELEKALSFHENNKDPYRLSFEDIRLATQNFSRENCIGGGGFGKVYKGELANVNGNGHYTIVAKKLDTSHGQGETQFYNELQILYEYKHENVIGLVGYSNETDEKIIVYEHASKGSLDSYLNDVRLTWRNRLKICIDFATGLDFLHGRLHWQEAVIHRDIKAANILLFDDWKAKIGDFGLSIISTINQDEDYVIDHVCGTRGYLDPLYLKSGFLTIESDIYSFGVVLFEILCGRSTYAIYHQKGEYLASFIKRLFAEGKQNEVVFEAIKEEIVPKSLTTFQNIAYQCLDDGREKRPTAKEVLSQLKKALEFQVYDVTNFLNDHPGGDNVLLDVAGKEASEEFEEAGHGSAARLMLDEYYIGEADDVTPSYSTSTTTTPKTETQPANQQASMQEDKQSRFGFMMKPVGLLPLAIFGVAIGYLLYK